MLQNEFTEGLDNLGLTEGNLRLGDELGGCGFFLALDLGRSFLLGCFLLGCLLGCFLDSVKDFGLLDLLVLVNILLDGELKSVLA